MIVTAWMDPVRGERVDDYVGRLARATLDRVQEIERRLDALESAAAPPVAPASTHHHRKRRTVTTPETISIDNVIYTRRPEPATPSEWRIVIADRGWVFVGRYNQDGDNVTLTDAKNIRAWGTTRGLGELATAGPTTETILDPAGTVRLHHLAIVATLDTKVTTW